MHDEPTRLIAGIAAFAAFAYSASLSTVSRSGPWQLQPFTTIELN